MENQRHNNYTLQLAESRVHMYGFRKKCIFIECRSINITLKKNYNYNYFRFRNITLPYFYHLKQV